LRLLVTGASGFLGGHVVEAFWEHGHEIAVMARRTSDLSAVEECIDEVRYGDMTDLDSMIKASREVDAILHCAGSVKMVVPYRQLRKTNAEGTRKLVRAAAENGVGRVIYASSLGVHGMEGDGRKPREKYCRSKAEAEEAFFDECSKGGVEGVALRPGVIYGPRDYTASYHMFRMMEKGNVYLIGDGNTRFPFIYIDDLVNMFLESLRSKRAPGRSFDLTGEEATPRRVFGMIADSLGVDFNPRSISYKMAMKAARWGELKAVLTGYRGDVGISRFVVQLYGLDHQVDSDEAREVLGFEPSVGLKEGLLRTAKWYRSIEP